MAISIQFNGAITGIYAAPVTIATTYAGGVVGQQTATGLTAIGGTKPYTYEVTAGALPPGVALVDHTEYGPDVQPRTFVEGTPTSDPPYTNPNVDDPDYRGLTKIRVYFFTLKVTDALLATVSTPCFMFVYELQSLQMSLPSTTFGEEYTFQFDNDYVNDLFYVFSHSAPVYPVTYALVSGGGWNADLLAVNGTLSATGLLRVPGQAAGAVWGPLYTRYIPILVAIRVTDFVGTNHFFGFPIFFIFDAYNLWSVASAQIKLLSAMTPITLPTNLGVGVGTFSIVDGSLPPGVSLVVYSPGLTRIQGTPTLASNIGVYRFTVQGLDPVFLLASNTIEAELQVYGPVRDEYPGYALPWPGPCRPRCIMETPGVKARNLLLH